MNDMHDAIHKRRGNTVVHEILDRLIEYTRIHFVVEESLMRILDYPEYEGHKKQHEGLLRHVSELSEKAEVGNTAIGFELMHFLKIWLTKHIMESDKRYTDHFLRAGAKPQLKHRSWVSRLWE